MRTQTILASRGRWILSRVVIALGMVLASAALPAQNSDPDWAQLSARLERNLAANQLYLKGPVRLAERNAIGERISGNFYYGFRPEQLDENATQGLLSIAKPLWKVVYDGSGGTRAYVDGTRKSQYPVHQLSIRTVSTENRNLLEELAAIRWGGDGPTKRRINRLVGGRVVREETTFALRTVTRSKQYGAYQGGMAIVYRDGTLPEYTGYVDASAVRSMPSGDLGIIRSDPPAQSISVYMDLGNGTAIVTQTMLDVVHERSVVADVPIPDEGLIDTVMRLIALEISDDPGLDDLIVGSDDPDLEDLTSVPGVIGLGLGAARARAQAAGLTTIVQVGRQANTPGEAGTVISQMPSPGQRSGSDSRITLVIAGPYAGQPSGATPAQLCSRDLPGSVPSGARNAAGEWICDCPKGTQWNDDKTACVAAPQLTPSQMCMRDMPGSIASGERDAAGNWICVCAAGMEWNQARTACVDIPLTPARFCDRAFPGSIAIGDDRMDGDWNCHCPQGTQWNTDRTACVRGTESPGLGGGDNVNCIYLIGAAIRARLTGDPAGEQRMTQRAQEAGCDTSSLGAPQQQPDRGQGNPPVQTMDCACRDQDGRRYTPMLGQDCGVADSLRSYCD